MGGRWLILTAVKEGWMNTPGKSPLESVFYGDYEELIYLAGLHLLNNIH